MSTRLASKILPLALAVGFSAVSSAGEIRTGATVEIVPNAIWFEDAGKWAAWRKLKQSGNSAALASYQDALLAARKAWQLFSQRAARNTISAL